MRSPALRLLSALLLFGTACGDDGDGPSDGLDPNNQAPTASFSASALTTVAGEPLAFDGNASSDPDGDALRFAWTFADGVRGGTAQLAHVFSTPGSYEVALLVSDGRGGTNVAKQTVTVTAGPSPAQMATATVRVMGPSRAPLADATVRVLGGATATTGADGVATVMLGTGVRQVLRVEKAGHTRQTQVTKLAATATSAYLEVALRALPAAVMLADAAVGGVVEGDRGTKVTLPAGALVDATGAQVTGAVAVQIAPIDVVADAPAFPGSWTGLGPDAISKPIVSYGTADFVFTQGDKQLDLAPGQVATIEIPVFPRRDLDGSALATGDMLPVWSLDEQSGRWVQEGQGMLVASTTSPTGLAQRAEVSHFTWWNCDYFPDVYEVTPKCCLDLDSDGVCDGPPVQCFLGARSCGNDLCDDDGTNTYPQYGASTTLPDGVGDPLQMPGAIPMALEAFGPDGLTRARVALPAGSTDQEVTLYLQPFVAPPMDQLITLPFETTTAAASLGTPTRYQVDATVGQNLWIAAERGTNSELTATLTLKAPNGDVLQTLPFGSAGASFVRNITIAGRYTIEVAATTPKPIGAYRLRVRLVGTEMTVLSMSPPAGSSAQPVPATITVTFARPVKVASVTVASFKVFGPAGEIARAAIDGIQVNNETVTFTPMAPFAAGFNYRVELTTAIQDTTNVPLIEAYTGSFGTVDVAGTFGRALPGFGSAAALATDGSMILTTKDGNAYRYTRYAPGIGWSPADILPGSGVGTQNLQQVGMGGNGLGMVAFTSSATGSAPYKLTAITYAPASGWSLPMTVPIDATERINSGTPQVAVDAMGRALVVWESEDGNHGWMNRYVPGTGWGTPALLDGGASTTEPRVVLNDAGKGAIVFRSPTAVRYARFDPTTGLAAFSSLVASSVTARELGIDTTGNVYVMSEHDTAGVQVHREPNDGGAVTTHPITGVTSACPPSLDVSPAGQVVVGFCQTGPSPYAVRWPGVDFTMWDTPVSLNAAASNTQIRVAASAEELFVTYAMPFSSVAPQYRKTVAGTWDAMDTVQGATAIDVNDLFFGSPTRVIFVASNGSVARLK